MARAFELWIGQNWRTLLGLILAGATAWYSLQAQVNSKADKKEVDANARRLDSIDANVRHTHEDLQSLINAYCRDRGAEFGCTPHLLPR